MTRARAPDSLRVAFIAGTLAQGGAEKQAVYMAAALSRSGVDVRVVTLGADEYYARQLTAAGLAPWPAGESRHLPRRMTRIVHLLRDFRPHIVQATHFYTTLHAALGARACGAIGIGAIRNDGFLDVREAGKGGRLLLRLPHAFVANSYAAKRNVRALGVPGRKIHVVWNVIAAQQVDAGPQVSPARAGPVAIAVARLIPAKRIDRFLAALRLAQDEMPQLRGVVVGEGGERAALAAEAERAGLTPPRLEFVGYQSDVAAMLREADFLVLSSSHEGFPNVILEAMEVGVPVITTPAGDAALVVQDGITGFVVPHDDVTQVATRMVQLARGPELRAQLGAAGQARVRTCFRGQNLCSRLLEVYGAVAKDIGAEHLLPLLLPRPRSSDALN